MAAEIAVTCPDCGEVKVWQHGMSLLLYPDNTGHYVFRCPECREMVTRSATAATVKLLMSVRVPVSRIRPRCVLGPRLTEDDLIEFGRSLESEGGDPWRELLGVTIS